MNNYRPFWSVFERIPKRTGFGDETLLSVYREYGVIRKSDRDDNHNRTGKSLDDYQLVEQGDLVFNKMKAWQGSLGISEMRGIVSPAYFVYRPLVEFNSRFMHHLLRSSASIDFYAAHSKGIRVNQWDLEPEQLNQMEVYFPPAGTQRRIAEYLDKETNEIDRLVGELDEYIELLEKRKDKVLIDGTKILDKDTPTTRLGWHASVELGKTIQGEQKSPADVLQKYVRAGNIQPDGRFEGEEKTMWFTPKESEIYSLKKGDVLIVEGGAGFGRSLTLEKDLVNWGFQNHIIRVRPDNGWDSKFIDYVIRAYKAAGYIDLLTVGATIPGFSSEKAKKLKVPFLTLEEQEEIVQDISRELSETNRIVEECTELKKILLKRRQVLITDVVTGKVEV
ncbi:MAG: restriction endonuclease subunit S [Corynebacterium glucuronolyticum]|nr:restriction endonuclease subunit S [Corynebacterium glucuronolyticum]